MHGRVRVQPCSSSAYRVNRLSCSCSWCVVRGACVLREWMRGVAARVKHYGTGCRGWIIRTLYCIRLPPCAVTFNWWPERAIRVNCVSLTSHASIAGRVRKILMLCNVIGLVCLAGSKIKKSLFQSGVSFSCLVGDNDDFQPNNGEMFIYLHFVVCRWARISGVKWKQWERQRSFSYI